MDDYIIGVCQEVLCLEASATPVSERPDDSWKDFSQCTNPDYKTYIYSSLHWTLPQQTVPTSGQTTLQAFCDANDGNHEYVGSGDGRKPTYYCTQSNDLWDESDYFGNITGNYCGFAEVDGESVDIRMGFANGCSILAQYDTSGKFSPAGPNCESPDLCGNGTVDAGEDCDDGNLNIPLATANKGWADLTDSDITLLSRSSCLETCVVAECSDGVDNDGKNDKDNNDGACRAGKYGAAEGAYAKGYNNEECPTCEIEGDEEPEEIAQLQPNAWPSGASLLATLGDACVNEWWRNDCNAVGVRCGPLSTCIACDENDLWCNRCYIGNSVQTPDTDITDEECENGYRCAYAGSYSGPSTIVHRCKRTSADLEDCYTARDCASNYDGDGTWKGASATTRCISTYCPTCGPSTGTCCPAGNPACGRSTTGGSGRAPICPAEQQPPAGATGGGSGGGPGGGAGGTAGGTAGGGGTSSSFSSVSSSSVSSAGVSSSLSSPSSSRSSSRLSQQSSSSSVSNRSSSVRSASIPLTPVPPVSPRSSSSVAYVVSSLSVCCTQQGGCAFGTCRPSYLTMESCLAACPYATSLASVSRGSVGSSVVSAGSVTPSSGVSVASLVSSRIAPSSAVQLPSSSRIVASIPVIPSSAGSSRMQASSPPFVSSTIANSSAGLPPTPLSVASVHSSFASFAQSSRVNIVIAPQCPPDPCAAGGSLACSRSGLSCRALLSPPCFECAGLLPVVSSAAQSSLAVYIQPASAPPTQPLPSLLPRHGSVVTDGGAVLSDTAACGNGIAEAGEECEDGNVRDFDGCSRDCLLERGSCGDGTVQTLFGEQCEPVIHDLRLSYGCTSSCRFFSSLCGNAVPDAGEQCDLGSQNSNAPNAFCRLDCGLARCGDSVVDTFSEACDDGNRLSGDGCNVDCKREYAAPLASVQLFEFPRQLAQPVVQQTVASVAVDLPVHAPVGNTGPASVAAMAAGAAAGVAWMRRRIKK